MNNAQIQAFVKQISLINYKNRKKPELAQTDSKQAVDQFLASLNMSREQAIDSFESRLEENTSQSYYATAVEILKQYV